MMGRFEYVILSTSLCIIFYNYFSQVYQNGDYVKNLSGNICGNDALEWSSTAKGLSNVIFISSFATW